MKTHKHWRIQNGQVVKCSPFESLYGAIRANTKGEATALFLHRAEKLLNNPPRVYVQNGAWLLVSCNGTHFVAESGVMPHEPANTAQKRRCASLCIAHHETLANALNDATFLYYASADYARIRGNQLKSFHPDTVAMVQTAQRLSDEAERALDDKMDKEFSETD